MLKYYVFRLMAFIAPLMPSRIGYFLTNVGGYLLYVFAREAKRNAKNNLRHVMDPESPEWEINRIVRGMCVESAKHYFELFRIPRLDLSRINEIVVVDHYEYVEQVLEKGRGMVIATAHCSNFDVLAQYLAAKGVGCAVPIERLRPPQLLDLITSQRSSKGLSFLPIGPATMVSLARVLKQGGVVAITLDRDINKSGHKVQFFGEETTMPVGPLELVRRTGAGLIMAFAVRQPDNTILGKVEPPIELQNTGNRDQDLEANLAKIVPILEKHIRAHPEQWAVFDPVWAT